VSDADPTVTLGELLDPESVPESLRRKVRSTEPSVGTFAVYLGMRRDLRAHGMGRFNVWSYPHYDLDALYAPIAEGRMPEDLMFFLSPNSIKDESGGLVAPGTSTLEIITFAPYAMFERWRELPIGARGADYEAEKNRIADLLLAEVEQRFPGLVGDIAVREISTPLSNEFYTLAVRGGAYGPALTPEQAGLRRFGTKTPLPNLFLAGAGVFGDGVEPCLLSGRVAAHAAERAVSLKRARRHRLRAVPVFTIRT
jgi:phytoene dehydrogenase-like protein